MSSILIAYNNDPATVLHDFLESCADEAKQLCVDNGITYSSVYPPDLNYHNVVEIMPDYQLCFLAGHGDENGIYNENGETVISTYTNNYCLSGKGFYSIACLCAQNLYPHLKTFGLQFFVGYSDTFNVRGEREPFIYSAMAGLKSLLSGDNTEVAKGKMLATYDEQIAILDKTDPMAAVELVHNKEALVFECDNDTTCLVDLE